MLHISAGIIKCEILSVAYNATTMKWIQSSAIFFTFRESNEFQNSFLRLCYSDRIL